MDTETYLGRMRERKRRGAVTTSHQLTGLTLAEILGDEAHKSLYMRLAKTYSEQRLIALAKDIAERKRVANKGAYFMRVVHETLKRKRPRRGGAASSSSA
ncbi:hypothetical protein A2110_02185 [Candidatus Jorgensenbacteria bacterium GWA1_54_12]|uniref:Uncharacterized protein n=1 Tax=Candidatus Jorgensenbacteria bacterium GWA1_54_12 TaxID=1798468 RepID=A0A1F6BLN5_9BACT|nr:MAG: hypothetical protein A2110_02185 [Candidatus Jorgensenbacteria bacterium GWA1_54_12]